MVDTCKIRILLQRSCPGWERGADCGVAFGTDGLHHHTFSVVVDTVVGDSVVTGRWNEGRCRVGIENAKKHHRFLLVLLLFWRTYVFLVFLGSMPCRISFRYLDSV